MNAIIDNLDHHRTNKRSQTEGNTTTEERYAARREVTGTLTQDREHEQTSQTLAGFVMRQKAW